jgi:hypothetical protein
METSRNTHVSLLQEANSLNMAVVYCTGNFPMYFFDGENISFDARLVIYIDRKSVV